MSTYTLWRKNGKTFPRIYTLHTAKGLKNWTTYTLNLKYVGQTLIIALSILQINPLNNIQCWIVIYLWFDYQQFWLHQNVSTGGTSRFFVQQFKWQSFHLLTNLIPVSEGYTKHEYIQKIPNLFRFPKDYFCGTGPKNLTNSVQRRSTYKFVRVFISHSHRYSIIITFAFKVIFSLRVRRCTIRFE